MSSLKYLVAAASIAAVSLTSISAHALGCTTSVAEVAVEKDGWVFIKGDAVAADGDLSKGVYVCNVKDSPNLCQAWLSMLQASVLSGRKVSFRVSDTAATKCSALPSSRTNWGVMYVKNL